MVGAKVDILIDETTRQRNHELIDGIFIPEEANLIKTIPLSRQEAEDRLFWPFTHNGPYTSKSGYCFLKSEEEAEINDEQMEQDRTLWRGIWSLQVPNKIKNMIWRACRNSLPTKDNLQRRTRIYNAVCDQCKLVPESAIHVLWSYTEMDVVWEDVSIWSHRRTNNFIDFKKLLSCLIFNQHHLELFSVMAWSAWTQRK
ncbi:hypothetical protein SO802_001765 [Lithocarpus litseifolius]|uniref:Reverse transcriptase zinc-binding domain-containing protein n=1 Tax=Lithocarpus litseifolius TaxID=425828 RepID=A0AAW2DWB0_9ROSI